MLSLPSIIYTLNFMYRLLLGPIIGGGLMQYLGFADGATVSTLDIICKN